ncbi:MAG: hypothetical protein V3T88_03185 [Nitrosomonadaceae bacterium]
MKILFILLDIVALMYVWHVIRKYLNSTTYRKNAKHRNLIHTKRFRLYYSGMYAWLEVDFGISGRHELSLLFGCVDGLVNWVYYNNK